MSAVQENEKALRYIGLLENARLNGDWPNIQELCRKVDKHAPHRKCLTLTATSEATIASAANQRPSTASSHKSFTGLLDVTPKLVQVIDQEKTYFEDAFQANSALHEIYFLRGEWQTIVGHLDNDVWEQVRMHTKNPLDLSGNTRVAILKNRYFLGLAREQDGNPEAAAQSYQSALKATENVPKNLATASQFRLWAERVLGRASSLHTSQGEINTISQASAALATFRNWSGFWDQIPGGGLNQSTSTRGPFDVSRRDVWGSYYKLLSSILASGLIYSSTSSALLTVPSDSTSPEERLKARVQQKAELQRVEAVYETLLLQETLFPKASQSNTEVELWVEQAIANWQILCGPQWRDADLGEGGKAAAGRNMLDILYRAATKTFHSTPILRCLFSVHASLAEFDLAMRAFDTYSEIITRAKSRAEKTGEHELGLDTDDQVMITAAQAISVLCKYGSRTEAEKALDISQKLAAWLQQQRPTSPASTVSHTRLATNTLERVTTESLLTPKTLAAAYRAIGHAEANWARLTYETSERKDLQKKALLSLRRAADFATPAGSDPETAVLLATVLAESRDFLPAIQVIKKALALASQSHDSDTESLSGESDTLSSEQRAAPLWHLLSLLLTARGEYDNAVKVCEAAFEQLNGPELFDVAAAPGSTEKPRPASANTQRLIDQMEDSVKDSLLQIRITQLALMEILDCPATAVDASSSLLALYHKLFGTPNANSHTEAKPQMSLAPPPPPPRTGTLKSLSGSIMGRRNTARSERPAQGPPNLTEPDRTAGGPVAIQVTTEDGSTTEKHHHHLHHPHIPHHPFKLRGHHGDWREAGNLKQQSDTNGTRAEEQPTISIPHNIDPEKQPPPLGHPDQPLQQDVRLPAPRPGTSLSPFPRFPIAQTRRHHISLLVDIWLFIAGQYLRSELFDDAEGAIDEAHKLVENFQQELAKEDASARAFDERGWGGGKSVNRLWADVYAERATLAGARNNPHEALSIYEIALSSFPDHPIAIVGISSLLLDIYEQKMPAEPASTLSTPLATTMTPKSAGEAPNNNPTATPSFTTSSTSTPAELNRLAARDRAYMLLSTLSKLGEGWDDSETWMALARAHEVSGQVERARECLWWVVELEDGRPVRPWGVVRGGL